MTHNNESQESSNKSSQLNPQQAQRRRLLKRGALLVPAIVTLHARPAMADPIGSYGADYNSYGASGEVTGAWSTRQEAESNSY